MNCSGETSIPKFLDCGVHLHRMHRGSGETSIPKFLDSILPYPWRLLRSGETSIPKFLDSRLIVYNIIPVLAKPQFLSF